MPTLRERRAPLTAAQQALAAEHLSYARYLARRWKNLFPSSGDDYESAASMALVHAARSYDPDRRTKFSTYARHRILGALRDLRRMAHRTRLRGGPTIAIDELAGRGGEPTCWAPSDGRELPVGDRIEAIDQVQRMLRELPRGQAVVCRLIYLEDKGVTQVAGEMGLSLSRVVSLHREALATLRRRWAAGARPDPSPTAVESSR